MDEAIAGTSDRWTAAGRCYDPEPHPDFRRLSTWSPVTSQHAPLRLRQYDLYCFLPIHIYADEYVLSIDFRQKRLEAEGLL